MPPVMSPLIQIRLLHAMFSLHVSKCMQSIGRNGKKGEGQVSRGRGCRCPNMTGANVPIFIHTEIVRKNQGGKKWQIILITHTPNIFVVIDMDLGLMLEGSSTQTIVTAIGALRVDT